MVDAVRGSGAAGGNGAGEIFQILRDGRARTKAELATLTGLARSTVSSRVDASSPPGSCGLPEKRPRPADARPPASPSTPWRAS